MITSSIVSSITSNVPSGLLLGTHTFVDTDAAAYAAAITAQGVVLTASQSQALDTFFGYGFTRDIGLKRLFLPIWNNQNANIIDLVTRATGSFSGTVTPALGHVKGDGSTGRFNFGASPSSLGIAHTSFLIGCLVPVAATKVGRFITAQVTTAALSIAKDTANTVICIGNSGGFNCYFNPMSYANSTGVLTINRQSSTNWSSYIAHREFTDVVLGGTDAAVTSPAITAIVTGMCRNVAGAYSEFTDAGFGGFFIGDGVTEETENNLSWRLRELWDALTGLTLP